jgi:hypothetical protein
VLAASAYSAAGVCQACKDPRFKKKPGAGGVWAVAATAVVVVVTGWRSGGRVEVVGTAEVVKGVMAYDGGGSR